MLRLDRWQEIFETIRRNLLRTLLTGVSVAWGIFMLVVLLAAGTGLRNSAEHDFRDDATNSLWIWSGQTSVPHEGHAVGRRLALTNGDIDALRREVPGVEHITGRFYVRGNATVSYRGRSSAFDIRSVHPDHLHLEKTIVTTGRFLNDLDLERRRKVAVIGDPVAASLMPGQDPIGRWLEVGGIPYRVVGTFTDEGNERELQMLYLPITTAQMAYSGTDRVHQVMFTIDAQHTARSAEVEDATRRLLAERHDFAPHDRRALRLRNNVERFQRIQNVLDWIQWFVIGVGVMTVLAGIVGVSNIMLIAVKERTREIGVRKALGATPTSIVSTIVQEAIVLTSVFGYLGLVAGVGAVELFRAYAPPIDYLHNPEIDIAIAVQATIALVVCGALAGFFPAWRAARIDPVVALRDE